jgi:VWFA-related protein
MRSNCVAKNVLMTSALCLIGTAPAFAQSVPPPPPPALPTPSPQSAVHVTTRIVQVRVTVHDKDGNPVTGLTKDDFTLFDQGVWQQITSFSEQTNTLTANSGVPAPNVFTNRFPQGVQPLLTVIVIDAYNARWWDENWCPSHHRGAGSCAVAPIFNEAENFITQMLPQDRVALYVLDPKGLFFLQNFTGDPSLLRRALLRAKDHIPPSIPRAQLDHMYAYTMDDMQPIVDRLASVSGRKNLIWLGPGFPPAEFAMTTLDKIDKAAKTLGNADLPLFVINKKVDAGVGYCADCPVPGGTPRGPSSGLDTPTPAAANGSYGAAGTNGRTPVLGDFAYIHKLADLSGGGAAGSIRGVIDDSAFAYLIGYYPDHNHWDGKFREIKVKVKRPGVSVRARSGYFAVADTASASEKDAQKLADAIGGPQISTDLGFDVQADGIEAAGARQIKVKITLDAEQLRFQQDGNQLADKMFEVWAEFDAEGHQVGTNSKTIDLKPTQDEYKQLLRDGLSFSETVPIQKDAAEIRLVLRDAGNGAIGSVIIPRSRLFATAAEPQTKK